MLNSARLRLNQMFTYYLHNLCMKSKPVRKCTPQAMKALMELAALAVSLNREDFHVFVQFHGHVGDFDIRVCEGGYNSNRGAKKIIGGCHYQSTFHKLITVKDIKRFRKILIESSEYKARKPQLVGQKYKIVRAGETLALMSDFGEAVSYAKKEKARIIPSSWSLFSPEEKVAVR